MHDQKRAISGATTRPSDTPQGSSASLAMGIRWVYPLQGSQLTWLLDAKTVLGRGDDCDARLLGCEASRHHAEIRREGPIHVVRDLGSTNGVFANGVRVGEVVLSTGDVLRFGDCIGVVFQDTPGSGDSLEPFECEEGLVAGPVLRPVLSLARRAASMGLPVVIQGETGTGKELVASAIHAWSGRKGPFLAVNCAALTRSLAEAELFGHRKGAFTGADRAAPGYFRAADGGTLFLDEISDLPLDVQPKLLRAIEQGEVIPVGEARATRVDVQLLAATQIPLRERVEQDLFRADLQARMDGAVVALPPLRERIEEVPFLFEWFLRKHSGGRTIQVDARLVERLCLYCWPRNVRELEHLARQLVGLHGKEPRLNRASLPPHIRASEDGLSLAQQVDPVEGYGAKDARDLAALARGLRMLGGNVARASALAGISRQRAYRLLAAHPEINPDAYRRPAQSDKPDDPEDQSL